MTRPNPAEAGPDEVGTCVENTPSLQLIGDSSAIANEWDARALTNEIKKAIDWAGNIPEMLVTAYEGRVWTFLGYPSWDAYCVVELDTERIRLPREERAEVVESLREQGLSIRAIAAATGSSTGSVNNDLRGVQKCTPATDLPPGDEPGTGVATPTTGLDGKTYKRPAPVEPPPKRRPLVEGYAKAVWDAEKIVGRLRRLHEDDRFASKRDQLRESQSGMVEMLRNDLDDLLAELHGEVRT